MTRWRAGTVVQIKSAAEIAATLDEDGTLDGLPFMPEMLPFCGQTAVVRRVAHKTCDAESLRQLDGSVHLSGLHCTGAAHGGCQLGCSFLWKDAWLAPAKGESAKPRDSEALRALAERSVRLHGRDPSQRTYSCQATEIPRIATALPWWSPGQYIRDVRSGNVPLRQVLRALPVILFNGYQQLSRRLLPRVLRIRDGVSYPFTVGTCSPTPTRALGLKPGEEVAILRRAEIIKTLDRNGLNRGLSFDWDMLPHCGTTAAVARRVEKIVDEKTGCLTDLANPCLVLDGIKCQGRYHRFCPRGQDALWHEIWLKRSAHPTED